MKKFLLFCAACLALSATAAPQFQPKQKKANAALTLNSQLMSQQQTAAVKSMPMFKAPGEVGPVISEFPGTPTLYNMTSFPEGYADTDMPVYVYTEGNDIYFDGLFFGLTDGETVIVKGTVENGVVSIPAQKIYNKFDYYGVYQMDLYIQKITPDAEGNVILSDDPYTMSLQADGSMINVGGDQYLGVFADLSDYGGASRELFTYNVNINLVPCPMEPVTLPEGAVLEEYTYSYSLTQGSYNDIAHVYIDGETVYLDGLTGGTGAWVKGTLSDGKLIVPSGQFLGLNGVSYIMTLDAVSNFVVDDEGYITSYEKHPALIFTVTEDGFVLDGDLKVGLTYPSEAIGYYMADVVIAKYAGDVPAVPGTPTIMDFQDLSGSYGQYFLYVALPSQGTKGEILRSENMEWAVWADDEINVFSADDGYYLSQDYEWFPAQSFMDDYGWYDLFCQDGVIRAYIYIGLFNELGVQARYTVDGQTYYSNIAYVDVTTGELRESEVDNQIIVGINNITAEKQQNLFDLQGRRVEAAQGLVISGGKVSFAK